MKIKYLSLAVSALCAALLSSCGGEEAKTDTMAVDTVAVETQMFGFDSKGGNAYQVPSPNELFGLIKNSKLPYRDGLVSTQAANYGSTKLQCLNFGRLTADIAYTASYEKFQESMSNFENLRKVGDDLGIAYVFDELMVNRVKQNMSNSDSLVIISNESYERIIAQLEEGDHGSKLAMIAAGGFVESIYLLGEMIGDYNASNELIQRLADQKLVMENVVDYLSLYQDDASVSEVLNEIQPLADVYMMLDEQTVAPSSKGDGKVVLGGSRIIITAAEYDQLRAAANAYRNQFTTTQQG